MMGFEFIKEMPKENMIEEILAHQRELLMEMEITALKATIIDIRVNALRKRLTEEAGITVTPGIFGASIEEKDE